MWGSAPTWLVAHRSRSRHTLQPGSRSGDMSPLLPRSSWRARGCARLRLRVDSRRTALSCTLTEVDLPTRGEHSIRSLDVYVGEMTCRRCVREVTARLRDVSGVLTVVADAPRSLVHITGSMSTGDVLAALAGTAFTARLVDGLSPRRMTPDRRAPDTGRRPASDKPARDLDTTPVGADSTLRRGHSIPAARYSVAVPAWSNTLLDSRPSTSHRRLPPSTGVRHHERTGGRREMLWRSHNSGCSGRWS